MRLMADGTTYWLDVPRLLLKDEPYTDRPRVTRWWAVRTIHTMGPTQINQGLIDYQWTDKNVQIDQHAKKKTN